MSAPPALLVDGLAVDYPGRRRGSAHRVLHDVGLRVAPGRTLGLVGESGSGKSTIGRAVLGLVPIAAGTIELSGTRVDGLPRRQRDPRDVQVVLQDPFGSLNPSFTVFDVIAEPIRHHRLPGVTARVAELLDSVGLPASAAARTPDRFSGGQRQRIAIARAMAIAPRLIVCDEPVSALDLTTQARVLDLFLDLQERTGVSYLFISHDLDVIRHLSHDVSVLDGGRIVEHGPAAQTIAAPRHPYTQRLLDSSPVLDVDVQQARRAARMSTPDAG